MPSSYTTNGGIEKIATGEQSGTWGTTTNTNFDIIDRLTSGVGTIDLSSSGAAHTLTTSDGTLSDGMYKVLILSGATQACTITIAPNDAQKFYFVDNNSGQDCTFSQGSGSNVTVTNGETGIIYANGAGSGAAVVSIGVSSLSDLGVSASATELDYNDITTLGTSQASKTVTADANGDVTLSEELKAKSYNETYATVSSSSGTLTIDCEAANVFQVTLSENVTTLTVSNPPASGTAYGFILRVVQDSTARTITWPASFKFTNGIEPTVSTGSGAIDVYGFFTTDGGSTWYSFTAGQDMS